MIERFSSGVEKFRRYTGLIVAGLFPCSPAGDGTRADVELTRKPSTVNGRLPASLLPLAASSYLRKSFAGPLGPRDRSGSPAPSPAG